MNLSHHTPKLYLPPSLIIPEKKFLLPTQMNGGFQSFDGFERSIAAAGGGGGRNLQTDVASTCFVLDASDSSSYSGTGQTFANVTASPADGSAKTDFDMNFGATSSANTDDPTFTGSAGVAGAYMALDGGDTFSTIISNPPPGFLKNMHKTTGGTDWWIAIALRVPDTALAKGFWSTQSSASTAGMRIQSSSAEVVTFFQHNGSAAASVNTAYTHSTVADFLFIMSANAGGSTIRYWGNSRTKATVSNTYGTGTTNPSAKFTLGGISPTATILPNLSRIYGAAGGNGLIDDTEAGKIYDYFNTSAGITFA